MRARITTSRLSETRCGNPTSARHRESIADQIRANTRRRKNLDLDGYAPEPPWLEIVWFHLYAGPAIILMPRLPKRWLRNFIPTGLAYPVLRGPLRGQRFLFGSAAGEVGGIRIYFGDVEPGATREIVRSLRRGGVFFDVGLISPITR